MGLPCHRRDIERLHLVAVLPSFETCADRSYESTQAKRDHKKIRGVEGSQIM